MADGYDVVGQLLPPPDLAPAVPASATPRQRIAIWLDLMRAGDKLLLAGLSRELGPDGDVQSAYRRWYAEHMREHDRTVARMLAGLHLGREERDSEERDSEERDHGR